MNDAAFSKSVLRTELRAARRVFAEQASDQSIPLPEFMRPLIHPGCVVTAYFPMAGEADPLPMAREVIALGGKLAMPHIAGKSAPMRFLDWSPGGPLERHPFGQQQPLATAAELVPNIILAPLVGFDAALHRLGQGGGYYDRVFARYPEALRVGVAWSMQQIAAVPVEPWDVPLNAVVTERGAIYGTLP